MYLQFIQEIFIVNAFAVYRIFPFTTAALAHSKREGKRARRLRIRNELVTSDNSMRRGKKNYSHSDIINIVETNSYRKTITRHRRRSVLVASNSLRGGVDSLHRQRHAPTRSGSMYGRSHDRIRTLDYLKNNHKLMTQTLDSVGHVIPDHVIRRRDVSPGSDVVTPHRDVSTRSDVVTSSHRRLIDECSWPQCNPSCPRIRNPFNGQEMDFFDLFTQFGLNVADLAKDSNVDVATLQSLDHGQLLQLLINSST